jgi:hypothetical protein
LIERAYLTAEVMGIAVWCEDEAGAFQTMPYPGESWQLEEHAQHQSHEYIRTEQCEVLRCPSAD